MSVLIPCGLKASLDFQTPAVSALTCLTRQSIEAPKRRGGACTIAVFRSALGYAWSTCRDSVRTVGTVVVANGAVV